MTKQYEAKTQLFVSVRGTNSIGDLTQAGNFAEKRVASYVSLATSRRVLRPVIDKLDLHYSPASLSAHITATSPQDTVLINVSATNSNPRLAAQIANQTASSLIKTVGAVEDPKHSGDAAVSLSRVEPAITPNHPAAPKIPRNLALGLAIGLVLGFGIAVLREVLDTRVRGKEDVAKITDASVLGTVANDPTAAKRPLIERAHASGRRAESYRQLRTHLHFTNLDGGPQTILVTSSIPDEGKSVTAMNLAILLAESGVRALLVDADLRRPSVAPTLGLESAVGLTTVLMNRVAFESAVQPWGDGYSLDVLTSGVVPPNPSELIASAAMENLIAKMQRQYDVVIIDSPPLVPVSDPSAIATLVTGVLLVVSADGTLRRDQLQHAVQSLKLVGARTLGLVMNRADVTRSSNYYDYSAQTVEPETASSDIGPIRHARRRDR